MMMTGLKLGEILFWNQIHDRVRSYLRITLVKCVTLEWSNLMLKRTERI